MHTETTTGNGKRQRAHKHATRPDVTDGKPGTAVVERPQPYTMEAEIVGVDALLFRRYDPEVVRAQGKAKKGSVEKKTDNVLAALYFDPEGSGEIGIPGANFKSALCEAAKYSQDPRSTRKSARDLIRASVRCPGWASLGCREADYYDERRVRMNQSAVTRVRPAMRPGWKATFTIHVVDPSYVTEDLLSEIVWRAGSSIGLCDFRPDFGTFRVVRFERQI